MPEPEKPDKLPLIRVVPGVAGCHEGRPRFLLFRAEHGSFVDIEAELKAIPDDPRPLLLVLTLAEYTPEYARDAMLSNLGKFAAAHNLPPFIVLNHGQTLEAVLDPRQDHEPAYVVQSEPN